MSIQEAKLAFQMSIDRMKRVLETTPDDRLLWSPAPSARTPLALVAHSANSLKHILKMLNGTKYATPTRAEADEETRAFETTVTSRSQAHELLTANAAAMLAWFDGLTDADLAGTVPLPFDMGDAPLAAMLMVPAWHTNDHTAQLEYIQTCYGDRTWN